MMIFFTHTHNTILNLEEISSLEESNNYLILINMYKNLFNS